MEVRDPFAILGIEVDADDVAVKAAFRTLAKRYHPDAGTEASLERFRDIKWASDLLSDPKSRADALLRRKRQSPGIQTPAPVDLVSHFGDFFENIDMNGRGREIRSPRRQANTAPGGSVVLSLRLEDAFSGGEFAFDGTAACPPCGGRGLRPVDALRTCPDCGGHGFTRVVRGIVTAQNECPTCAGKGLARLEICSDCAGSGVDGTSGSRTVRIPPGCRDGFTVKVGGASEAGRGWPGFGGTDVVVNVRPHARFTRDGENLETGISIPVWDAALGGKVTLQGIDGKPVVVSVPAGSQDGQRLVVPDAGMPAFSGRGELGVTLSIRVPDASSGDLREAFKALREAAMRG